MKKRLLAGLLSLSISVTFLGSVANAKSIDPGKSKPAIMKIYRMSVDPGDPEPS